MTFLLGFPADPEGRGLCALRRHRYPFPAACGGHLGPPFSLQFEPISCHGSRARGASHRVVQPLCPPPLLWQDGHQLRGHAHEYDTSQGEIFQGTLHKDHLSTPCVKPVQYARMSFIKDRCTRFSIDTYSPLHLMPESV